MKSMNNIKVFSGSASVELATKVAAHLKLPLGEMHIEKFSDGEFQPIFDENLRGKNIYLIQSCYPPFDNYWELFQSIDACKRASASKIIVCLVYYGYERQDRKDRSRVGIASKLIAKFLESAGASRVISIDLHADQIQGFFDIPFDQLFGSYIFYPQIENMIKNGDLTNLQFASPDNGGIKRMSKYAEKFDTDYIICSKQRKIKNEVSSMTVIGNPKNKDIIIIDDMIDTGGTICKAADLLIKNGANSVRAMITHPILSGKALDNIEKSNIKEIFVLNTIPLKQEHPKIKVLDCSSMLAKAIKKIESNKSLSSLFIK
jgi:ribose-phosphate pyrophosphokinase